MAYAGNSCWDGSYWTGYSEPDLSVMVEVGSAMQETWQAWGNYYETFYDLLDFGCQPITSTLTFTLMDTDTDNEDDLCFANSTKWM